MTIYQTSITVHAYVRPMINRISIAKSIHDNTLEMNMRMKWTHMSVKKSKDDYIRSGVRYAFLKKNEVVS